MNQEAKVVAIALILCCSLPSVSPGACTPSCGGRVEPDGPEVACLVLGVDLDDPEPFMASLRRSNSGDHFCGGTLIHPKVVLTAAHCVENGLKPDVDIGRCQREGSDKSGFDSYRTVEVIPHENYNSINVDYDIALLVLDSESPRELLPLAVSDSCFEGSGGCKVRLLGWGTDAYGGNLAMSIQDAFTTSVSRQVCENLLGTSRITDQMICAGELKDGKYDSCQGDSGGPMILDGQQVGIVSFGFGCGTAQSPGVYASVPKLRSWIDTKLSIIDSRAPLVGDPCDCAEDGISDGVPTFRLGCRQHLLETGDEDFFCMTAGGLACSSAQPSDPFPGAGWRLCSSTIPPGADPCACAEDGVSNGIATSRFGCKPHLAVHGNNDVFCMTVGGLACSSAQPSDPFRGAGWRLCG